MTEVFYQVKQGEMIVREGERITESQILKLQAMRKIGSDSKIFRSLSDFFSVP